MESANESKTGLEIAVIGMAGRFPGARNIRQFWDNLKNGVESISFFSNEELIQSGVEAGITNDLDYIKAYGALAAEDVACFDSDFFDYFPMEAQKLDPQVRIFHECSWEALENAGYDPRSYPGLIGVYAGASSSFNWEALSYLPGTPQAAGLDSFAIFLLADRDFLSTHVSYKLNLKGPGLMLQTACSTSLVAIHQACRALLTGECDMALAGGVTVKIPQRHGYIYKEGMIASPDGHCRTFDARAKGTIGGSGIGIVVLKRLESAVADGDDIDAVIKGAAINNDGKRKVGYTAPSVEGQVEVIHAALQMAEVEPESISYIETHGTGTTLGDSVEIEALNKSFNIEKKCICALGAVKTNVGHLDSAAGVAGFIKTVLALKHSLIPPSLHFETSNPKIPFENTPFYVNTKLTEWKNIGYPLRAGVSSFGIGGTNAHVILEEAPMVQSAKRTAHSEECTTHSIQSQGRDGVSPHFNWRPYQLILLSAKTSSALERMTMNLANYLRENNGINMADAAYTLQVGRAAFKYRKMLVCAAVEEAIEALSSPDSDKIHTAVVSPERRPLVFMFPGQGAQYVNMGWELYQKESLFRKEMNRCFEILEPLMGYDIKEILYPGERNSPSAGGKANKRQAPGAGRQAIDQTEVAQPLIFIISYALAKLLLHWGIKPYALIGHSIGEYTAACLSGIFSLEDALKIVVLRGRLMQKTPPGAMLGVSLSENQLKPLLTNSPGLSIAAVNGPSYCVVSGPHDDIEALARGLRKRDLKIRHLHTSHAFHSSMMDLVLEEYQWEVSRVKLNKPQVPYISNVTGDWITTEDARDPQYWARHMRETVRFANGLEILFKEKGAMFIEVGPGTTLSTFARQHVLQYSSQDNHPGHPVINLLSHPNENVSDLRYLLDKVGKMWFYGKAIDWWAFYSQEKRSRIPLPAYPFDSIPYPVDLRLFKEGIQGISKGWLPGKKPDIADWFYVPLWEKSIASVYPSEHKDASGNWLVFMDEEGVGTRLVKQLEKRGHQVIAVRIGTEYQKQDLHSFILQPTRQEDYASLFKEIQEFCGIPHHILHLWCVSRVTPGGGMLEKAEEMQNLGFYSLLHIAQAIGSTGITEDLRLRVVTNNMHEVTGEEALCPEKALILGAIKVIPLEYPNIRCSSIDIILPEPGSRKEDKLVKQLLAEFNPDISEEVVALRGTHRWVQIFKPTRFEESRISAQPLKEKGVYLVTGGLGGIGFTLAEHLARTLKARLVLTGRSALPDKKQWEKIREMEELGAEVMVETANVAHREQMQEVMARAKQRFGSINGIIHSAGIPDGAFIQARIPGTAAAVLEAKVKGTLVLDGLLKDEPLDFFVLCSSLNSIIAATGQVAYSAANAFQDAFAYYKTLNHGIFTVSINWDTWQEVGMAAAAARKKQQREAQNQTLHPLFDRCVPENSAKIYISHLSVKKNWVLDEHRILGKATLPGTTYLEMARAALEHHSPGETSAIEISQVYFLQPLVVEDDEEKEVRTILQNNGNGFEFFVISRLNSARDTWLEHARGEIKITPANQAPLKKQDMDKIAAACQQQDIIIARETGKTDEELLTFGPRWSTSRQVKRGPDQALVALQLPGAFIGDLDFYQLHPALLDTALAGFFKSGAYYLPFSYKKVKINQSLAPRIFSHIKALEHDKSQKEFKHYKIVIMDEQGTELIDIEEYTLMKVPEERIKGRDITGISSNASSLPASLPGLIHGNSDLYKYTSRELSDATDPRWLKHGILPPEGVEVFQRVLSARLPQVTISTIDFHARREQDRNRSLDQSIRAANETSPGMVLPPSLHARPEISSKYVKPGKEIEKKIARVFQTFLGIEGIGIYDNFFELGANSMMLVQVNSQLQKELEKDLSVVNIYAFPTVKSLSEFLSREEALTSISEEENQQLKHQAEKGKSKLMQRKLRRKSLNGAE
jgi:acyl transferase domain-containing protein